ncbi:ABC transporter ATP-binding protein [Streptomyces sp. NPDC001642]|uniref:ABC transporter ATP-binding protein n=1 Tax=Streptomyces sp. NPDC001642 TaxID=3154392 RepID=UPI0033213BA2
MPNEATRPTGTHAHSDAPAESTRATPPADPRHTGTLPHRGLRFLLARRPVLIRLAAWSVLETGQTFLVGYGLARALDAGFLVGRSAVGLGWLALAGIGVVVGAFGTGRVYRGVADLVEPLRDRLVERVVVRGVREGNGEALSGLTQQVELARDTFAGLVMVSRSFLFTAVGALAGLCSLDPVLLLVVAPPLLAGVSLFAATLRPLARRQETFLLADEALADGLGTVCPGLRDITAAGAEEQVAADTARLVDTEFRAARSLARWGVLRVAALAIGGQLPIVLLLATAPWLLGHGVTPGGLVGALAYVTQSLHPALQNLVHGLGTSGSRLTVVLRRLTPASTTPPPMPTPPATPVPHLTTPPALTLTSLTFAYGTGGDPVLRDLTLALPQGAHLAVVGPSGIGKSTLTALAAGLLRPGHGTIRMYGRPVSETHSQRVLIPQEAYVFSGTLAENLGHLRPDPVPEAELLAAAEAVGLTALLKSLGGPGAPVDPSALSAGERQLIALTRAYLSYAPLALLDEATCHLDPEAEERAERAFAARERPGGALVVVAHRISSARRAGRVLVMDGRETALGTHDDLLRRSPLYRDLVGSWSSEPALALGDTDRVDAVAGSGLAGDGRHVVAHGPVGQVQVPGDLRDGGPLGGQG